MAEEYSPEVSESTARSKPTWEEENLPFHPPRPLTDQEKALWSHYGHATGRNGLIFDMLEAWEMNFSPLIGAAENLIEHLDGDSQVYGQVRSLFRVMQRSMDDFWEIWKFGRQMIAHDPIIQAKPDPKYSEQGEGVCHEC